jgi:hypothetical protein
LGFFLNPPEINERVEKKPPPKKPDKEVVRDLKQFSTG